MISKGTLNEPVKQVFLHLVTGAQNLRHKKKTGGRRQKDCVEKKTANFSRLTSHADIELLVPVCQYITARALES